eukprot:230564-Rhodomonas_salina.1
MDLKDMFLSWNVHPERWVLLGFRHPLTSQAYVYPVLPFGLTISPPIACRNTQLLADLIEKEMRARWEGREGLPALRSVARTAPVPETSPAPPPASSVYVDDYANSACDEPWMKELVAVAARIFELVGVTEKVLKREGPARALDLLGMRFSTVTHELSIPERKCSEILVLLEGILGRCERRQSVSWHELESMVGKLMWASGAVELGKAYLRQMRKPGVAVSELLKTRMDRNRFCIPLYMFPRALEELRWWLAALKVCGGKRTWHVDGNGFFKAWRWECEYGTGTIPAW